MKRNVKEVSCGQFNEGDLLMATLTMINKITLYVKYL